MCGIVGYVGGRPARDLLLAGLERLEYRGYDSAGISVNQGGRLASIRAVGNMARLRASVERGGLGDAALGIGHTRWATHGGVCLANAHPHSDPAGRVHVAVNGIVENYVELKAELEREGGTFSSETDAEVIAHLVARELDGDGLTEAVRRAYARLRGHYAFVALAAEHPDLLVAARKDCPLVVGRGDGEQFVASAIPAFAAHTSQVQWLEDGELAAVSRDGVWFTAADGAAVTHAVERVESDGLAVEKGPYETFMLKEIHEQPGAVADTLAAAGASGAVGDDALTACRRVVLLGCGTSYHAALITRYALERWLRVPIEVDIASEYRYREPVVGPGDLVIGVSQSGETADTLAAMRLARDRGATVLAVTNAAGSRATRDADGVVLTRAGLEVGVAATKSFVAQVAALHALALRMAALRAALPSGRVGDLERGLATIPGQIGAMLAGGLPEAADRVAGRHAGSDFFLYLGRHAGLGVALEGALKLKEISYIAADAYAAGEMKHGPIALLGEGTPVVVVATDSPVLDKVASNMQQVRARGAHVIAVATAGNHAIATHADEVLWVPRTDWPLQPLLAVVPLQLLAYRIARLRGLDVDQPRNLAKTVTVE